MWSRLTVDHFVVNTNVSVGEVHAEFIAELTRHDHRLGNHFARQRIDLAGVDDLVVHGHHRSADEVEPVGVVGHGHAEVVVPWNLSARVPCTLNAEVADVQFLATLVGQVLLEP